MEKIIGKFINSLSQREKKILASAISVDDWLNGGEREIARINSHISVLKNESHKLAGTAGSLGFDELSKKAFAMMHIIESYALDSEKEPDRDLMIAIKNSSASLIEELRSCIANPGSVR